MWRHEIELNQQNPMGISFGATKLIGIPIEAFVFFVYLYIAMGQKTLSFLSFARSSRSEVGVGCSTRDTQNEFKLRTVVTSRGPSQSVWPASK